MLSNIVRQVLITEANGPLGLGDFHQKSQADLSNDTARTDIQMQMQGGKETSSKLSSPKKAKKMQAKISNEDRVYWSAMSSAIGTHNATGAFPGEEAAKKGTAGLSDGYPHMLPGAIHLGPEIGKGDGVWWGKDGKYEKMSDSWEPWKQQTRVRIQKLGMTGRGKARFLTAVAFVMPVIGAAVSVIASNLLGSVGGTLVSTAISNVTAQVVAAAKDARSKVSTMTKSTRGESMSTIAQSVGDSAGTSTAAKLSTTFAPKP